MLSIVLIAIVVIIAALLALAATKPDTFRIERSAIINTSPDKVFGLIEDFHRWNGWSPWEKLDPAMMRTFTGAASGKGAIYEWEGNKKVGKGRMEIADLESHSQIRIKLDFFSPFEAHNIAEFTLENRGNSVYLKWAMFGPASFAVKVMHLFMNMDKMVGKDFETGLANLKSLAENSPTE